VTDIAIIGGTGALGAALARRLAIAGHRVFIGSRDPAKAADFAAHLAAAYQNIRVTGHSVVEAAQSAEICVLAVPYAAHAETLEQIRHAVRGRIVIDPTAPLRPPKVGTVQLPASGSAATEAAAALGPQVRVVSALQTIGAEKLASGQPIEADVLVAADDAEAAEIVRALLSDLGLRSWHVGPLANSAAAEAMTSILIQINRRYRFNQAGLRITGRPKDKTTPATVNIRAVPGLRLFSAGDDLAQEIGDAVADDEPLLDGDVIVVAQKVVSKVEGRAVTLSAVEATEPARNVADRSAKDPALIALILSESSALMRVKPGLVIARHRLGHVAANAGIDASNVPAEDGPTALLWPVDPDASAHRIRERLEARFQVKLSVVISDSLGRAWRMGTMGAAIGSSGIAPLRDRRGEEDLFGRRLQATIVGVADEIAAAASLVIGEAAEGTPVAVVRGAQYQRDEACGVGDILRPAADDLFP
jgi:coenzyme F420-0:L-glutamate ligase/NADPH-dependent F420 reductase